MSDIRAAAERRRQWKAQTEPTSTAQNVKAFSDAELLADACLEMLERVDAVAVLNDFYAEALGGTQG